MKYLVFAFLSAYSSLCAGVFEKNEALVEKFKQNHVRLLVLCNFQGTNNVLDIVSSSLSPLYELTQYGIAHLNHTIPKLEGENISQIFASPAFRSQQTANRLGKAFKLAPSQVSIDPRLGMQWFGDLEGEDYDAYKSHFKSLTEMLKSVPVTGEPGDEVFRRLEAFLMSLETFQGETILIITHAFNYCHISMCLTGQFGILPSTGTYMAYDFN